MTGSSEKMEVACPSCSGSRRPCDARDTGYPMARFDSREIAQQAKAAYDIKTGIHGSEYIHQTGARGV
jgi:hypothetical protein